MCWGGGSKRASMRGSFIITWLSCSARQKGTLSATLRRLLSKTCGNSNWKEDDFGTHHSGGLVKRKGFRDGAFSAGWNVFISIEMLYISWNCMKTHFCSYIRFMSIGRTNSREVWIFKHVLIRTYVWMSISALNTGLSPQLRPRL